LPAITVVQPTIATAKETSTLNWPEVITKLSLSGLGLMLVKNCVVSKWDGKVLVLTLDSLQKACLNPQRQMQIQEVLTQYFGHPIKLTINVGDAHASPLKIEQEQAKQRQSQAKASIEEDKTVQNILSTFDATVEKITVIDQ
jgi:DNA polymerase-3 subunit gamma/tau